MDLQNRKNKFHSNQSYLFQEDNNPSYLSPFVRSSHSPSYIQIKSIQQKTGSFQRAISNEKSTIRQMQEFQELKNHYQCIQKVLNEENLNLKMQAKYLASQMRKNLKREKIQKQQLKSINQLYQKTKSKLAQILQQNLQIKQFVQSKIIILLNSIKITNINEIVREIKIIIQQFCQYFNINLQPKNWSRSDILVKDNPIQQEQNEINKKIQQLSDKFQKLMSQYQSTNRPQIRKKCIQICKQIKNLKVNQTNIIHDQKKQGQKKIHNLSRQQSNQYLQIKSRHSKNGFFYQDIKTDQLYQSHQKRFSRSPVQIQDRLIIKKNHLNGKLRPSSFRQTSEKH